MKTVGAILLAAVVWVGMAGAVRAEGRVKPLGWVPAAVAGPGTATKERPFVNGLGMRFVPVVEGADGKKVLFSVWETRVEDYAAYAKGKAGVDMGWKDCEYEGQKQGAGHPVVNVSWEDAQGFCAWLTERERASGKIGRLDSYRLPTDHEWSVAVGIGEREDAGKTPEEKDAKIAGVYPWGTTFPPADEVGNYADSAAKRAFDFTAIEGYDDGYAFTAPAGSYAANRLGIYDLGGNVWEWCEDWYDPKKKEDRVVRGGAWDDYAEFYLRSSCRVFGRPSVRDDKYGFRVVVEVGGGGS